MAEGQETLEGGKDEVKRPGGQGAESMGETLEIGQGPRAR